MSGFEIVHLKAGGVSLRAIENGETFHPVTGPMAEARRLHAGQARLSERARQTGNAMVLWDVGLGAAANALAAIEGFEAQDGRLCVESFDLTISPLAFAIEHAEVLGYPVRWRDALSRLRKARQVELFGGRVRWTYHEGNFAQTMARRNLAPPHAVFYDPYSPQTNPGMWTLTNLASLFERLDPERPCLLTSYSRSTAVRVTLLLAGFFVGRGCSVAEKEETTVASNDPDLLEKPLDLAWLARASRSTNGAPIDAARPRHAPISAEILRSIERLPQFAYRDAMDRQPRSKIAG